MRHLVVQRRSTTAQTEDDRRLTAKRRKEDDEDDCNSSAENWCEKLVTFEITGLELDEAVIRHVLLKCHDLKYFGVSGPEFSPKLDASAFLKGLEGNNGALTSLKDVRLAKVWPHRESTSHQNASKAKHVTTLSRTLCKLEKKLNFSMHHRLSHSAVFGTPGSFCPFWRDLGTA
jgi:hypothetical protein